MTRRCLSCMSMIEHENCPNCGYPDVVVNEGHQLCVGTMLRDRYQIGKVLGQGGFGITYLGWDTLMRNTVAVKEFYPGGIVYRRTDVSARVECVTETMIPRYENSRERFLREASALVDFQHIPEIVDILDFIEENNTAYIVMEYVKGMDLAKYIQMRGGRLSVEETFRILRPVMEALAKVHGGGIVHRDISPDNIILDPMGGAKLLDFGAVRVVEDPDVDKGLNKSTEAILKHGFAPLEQYNSRGSLGPWTDEYAMCATVWYCLTGTIPADPALRLMEGNDPDWSTIPGLPEHQQRALRKGISCRAQDRYATMELLLADLFPAEYISTDASGVEKWSEDMQQGTVAIPKHQQDGMGSEVAVAPREIYENKSFSAYVGPEQVQQAPKRKRSKKTRRAVSIVGALLVMVLTALVVFVIIGAASGEVLWFRGKAQKSDDEHRHEWVPASCTDPKYCSECGKERGAALGHDWADASCTETKRCMTCGITDGTALGHQWIDATMEAPKCCSSCGKYEGRSLGKSLTAYTVSGYSEDSPEDKDIRRGSFTDLSGNSYDDAFCFWVSTQLVSYEYVEYMLSDLEREGLGIQIEYRIALTKIDGTWFEDDELSAYVSVFVDGARVGGTSEISGTETESGVLDIPAGSILRVFCDTNSPAWTNCIFEATVYYTALPEQQNG